MFRTLFFALVIVWASMVEASSSGLLRIGIFPVVDETGERFGDSLSENLTRLIFFDCAKAGLQPVFLNPGRDFDPADKETAADLAKQAGVDAILQTKLIAITDRAHWSAFLRSLGDARATERLTTDLSTLGKTALYNIDVSKLLNGKRALLICETSISSTDGRASNEKFYNSSEIKLSFLQELGLSGTDQLKFKNTPAGQAAKKASEHIAHSTSEIAAGLGTIATGEIVKGLQSCEITFRINYVSKRRASKNYTVAINGKEETLGIQDGVLQVRITSGLLHIRATVQDPPYRLPVQRNYDANVYFDCQGSTELVLEIGAAGEAFLVWK